MPFTKGHKLSTGRPHGSKNVATLLKEERRAIFEAEISQRWKEVIKQLPPTYIADQYLGKAPDKVEVETSTKPDSDVVELANQAAELLRKKKLHGDNTRDTNTS